VPFFNVEVCYLASSMNAGIRAATASDADRNAEYDLCPLLKHLLYTDTIRLYLPTCI
jgi:hypothetical protein